MGQVSQAGDQNEGSSSTGEAPPAAVTPAVGQAADGENPADTADPTDSGAKSEASLGTIAAGWGSFVRQYAWQGIAIGAVLIAILVWIQPFSSIRPPPAGSATSRSWNDSISLLDIQPVYPPTEDFSVGDVIIAVANAEGGLLGKSMRVAHIDLRSFIEPEAQWAPVFDLTAAPETDKLPAQSNLEIAPGTGGRQIALKLVAFPGLMISRNAQGALAAGTSVADLSAGRDDHSFTSIQIPVALTYGVSVPKAAGMLAVWCSTPDGKPYCTDSFSRQMLSYVLGPAINVKDTAGSYVYKLQLMVVARVFMTRELRSSNQVGGSRGVKVARPQAAGVTLGDAAADAPAPPAAAVTPEPNGDNRAGFDQSATDDLRINAVFQKPLVFGFRSANLELAPISGSGGKP
ncbi:hypothetical protein GGR25_001570 [Kaistia hirudinis]|uniref:Uncharacterized protein n=1 Tax=Kaistia hirudinis TaxID=1293440 RepID=A0A840ANT1_9HYPH|nr:hypothetical protein [Kaistia hirudinis]MBB3930531.1 hypothetical protein [Kaistia hirudinis]